MRAREPQGCVIRLRIGIRDEAVDCEVCRFFEGSRG